MLRRTFLKTTTIALNGLIAAGMAIPGIRYLLHPLYGSRASAAFQPVTTLDALPTGRPTRVTIVADRQDSYTRYPAQPIGAVWLLRNDQKDKEPTLTCWQVICPHLGCGIDFSTERSAFACPCHASEFDLAGRCKHGPAPRDMDRLECRVASPNAAGQRWVEVKYEQFQTGLPERRALS